MATILLSCGTEASQSIPPEQIVYREVGPHGQGSRNWIVHVDGRGRYQSDLDGPVPLDAVLNIGWEGFQEISDILRPLETRGEINCVSDASDQPIGIVTWVRGIQHVSVHIDFGCAPAAGEDALQRLELAVRMIRGGIAVSQPNDDSLPTNPGPDIMPEGGVLAGY